MPKPHEETWTTDTENGVVDADGKRVGDFRPYGLDEGRCHSPDELARATLAAAAPAMARLLLAVYEGSAVGFCTECGRHGGDDHAPDCAVVAVLRAAGVLGS